MLASEAISILLKAVELHGDLPVVVPEVDCCGDLGHTDLESITPGKAILWSTPERKWLEVPALLITT